MIPIVIAQRLQQFFKAKALSFERVGGGSINEAFSFKVGQQTYFLKYNEVQKYPKIIEYEVEGLAAIQATHAIKTPEVVFAATMDDYEILVLPFIIAQHPNEQFWSTFGQQLAAMHQANPVDNFGWHHDNYIGSLPQQNTWENDFITFWINHRIAQQLKLASTKGLLTSHDLKTFDQLFKELPNIFPEVRPSLVHGDLWSGNFMANNGIGPILIDPSIHFSHPETDLAFTYLFGGFDSTFYKAYQEVIPIEGNFKDRISIYNLYPLLVHLNLFGSTYYSAIKNTITPFAAQ